MPPPEIQVPSDARRFSPVMTAFIDSIRHCFISRYKILAKGSGTCPTSCYFVTLRLFFFFSSSRNRTLIELLLLLVTIIYGAFQLFVNSIFVIINMVSFNSRTQQQNKKHGNSKNMCNTKTWIVAF